MNNYYRSIATLVGTIVGVGLFTIPYAINKAGLAALFIYLPILGLIEYFLLKLYAEVILSTKNEHRLPGFVEKYLGEKHKTAALIITMLSNYGSILAYIIIGGIFLNQLLTPFFGENLFLYASILFGIESFIVLFGLKLIARVEFFMTVSLMFIIGLIVLKSWNYVDAANFASLNWDYVFLPYGPIFFAVTGVTAVPEICRLLDKRQEKIKSALGWGVGIACFITFIFAIMIVGVTGAQTTADTLTGLKTVFGNGVVTLSLVFGVFAIMTSFFITTQAMREVYWWDFKMNKNLAWAIACGVPYLAYAIGAKNLTTVVSLTGAFTGGIIGILFIWLALRARKKAEQESYIKNKINKPLAFLLSLLFVFGLVYEVWSIINV